MKSPRPQPAGGRRAASLARLWQATKFAMVGASGMLVNTVALAFATEAIGIHYLVSVALATQASTVWNYLLIDGLVFSRGRATHSTRRRFGSYWVLNMTALVGRYPIIWLLTSVLGIHYVISNLMTLVLLFLVRFFVSDRWIWTPETDEATDTHSQATGGQMAGGLAHDQTARPTSG